MNTIEKESEYEKNKRLLHEELLRMTRPVRDARNPPKGCGPICPYCGIVAIKLVNEIHGNKRLEMCRHCKKNKSYITHHTRTSTVDKNYVPPKELLNEVLAN